MQAGHEALRERATKPGYGGDRKPITSLKVQALAKLEDDWDTYGAPALRYEVLRLADDLWSVFKDKPSVVPKSDGGVYFEWKGRGYELSLEFDAYGRMQAFWMEYPDGFQDQS